MIIIVLGLPGSGKSYFAAKLAKKLQATYVSSDVIRNQLFTVKQYTKEEKMKVYTEMIGAMKKAMQQKINIILDATFHKKSIRNIFCEAAKELGQNIIFIEVRADENIIQERLSRKRPYSDADYSVYLLIKEVFEPIESEHLILRSTQENIENMMDMALNYIQKRS